MSTSASLHFRIEKMDCPSCLATLERCVVQLDGVESVSGSVVARTLRVEVDSARIPVERVRDEIGRAGYVAEIVGEDTRRATAPSTWWSGQARIAYASLALFLVAMALRGFDQVFGTSPAGIGRLPDALLVGSALVGGWNFFPKAIGAARSLRLDMNFLMTVAIIGAIAIGEFAEAAAIAFLFSLAELLESFAVDRARASVTSLMSLSPDEATVLRDGREVRVRANDVVAGETVVLRAGERIPVDAVVIAGHSSVDESSITGEPIPLDKSPGDPVYSGTVNETGMLQVRATRRASASTLAKIVELLEEAEATKPKSERFVERFARWYTPAVTLIAVGVATIPSLVFGEPFTLWFVRGLTLLVIACPCALVISTPVTVVSGITAAARNGVLIKGGLYLEALASVESVAFDKTGTLTVGHPQVLSVLPAADRREEDVLAVAAAVESGSRHPIARAIVDAARDRGLDRLPSAQGFQSLTGTGVRAAVDDVECFVGRPAEAELPDLLRSSGDAEDALSVVEVKSGSEAIGWITLGDRIRPQARSAVQELRAGGLHKIVMLTGDHVAPAELVAGKTEIEEVRAGLLPEEKLNEVRSLATRDGGVAMIGDGVNDAPALAAATVGIAMGAAGSDTALEAADVALIGDDLGRLPYLFELSRKSRRIIRQNIAIALGVKLALVLAVPFGVVSLIAAVVIGDMGVSMAVIGNALRLGGFAGAR